MNRQQISNILYAIGAIATLGLIVSGVLTHYGVLPLGSTLGLILISVFAIVSPVCFVVSMGLASSMKRETFWYIIIAVVYGVSLLGVIISFIQAQSSGAPWWPVFVFVLLLVASSLLLPVFDARRKKTMTKRTL